MALPSRAAATATALALAVGGVGLTAVPAGAADSSETLSVDFSKRTGDFRGGATGTLYGFGDEGSPTHSLINGAHITNTSQKPPEGLQHPSGDSAKIESSFTQKHGEDLIVYMQDLYPDWGYHGGVRPGDTRTYDVTDGTWVQGGNGTWDYLEVVEAVTNMVADTAQDPDRYVFKLFNEPDGIWYQDWGRMRDPFLADWQAAYAKVQEIWAERGYGKARIAGTGESHWDPQRTRDFFGMAAATDTVPDIFVWHELGINNVAAFDGHLAEYRTIEREFGIAPLPVNITEWGMLRDMGVPGQLLQWFSTFEDAKVDAQTAYWNYAGNFSDNSARANGANGGWWIFKWYGDLAGSETVTVTPPRPNTVETLQGIGAIDDDNRRATVLFGGTGTDVDVAMTGIPASLGSTVDVEVREVAINGAQGLSGTPRVIKAQSGVAVTDAALTVDVDVLNAQAGYQVIITPAGERDLEADAAVQAWEATSEAENTRVVDAQVYNQPGRGPGGDGWNFQASGLRDVGSFNRAGSRLEWTVDVPRDGRYRFQSLGGANAQAGKHALFVNNVDAATLEYTAGLGLRPHHQWQYRGTAEAEVDLKAGQNVLSVRASRDGSTRLPGSDISLDKFTLTEVSTGEPTVHPASTFRLYDGAALDWTDGEARGAADIPPGARADLYVNAMRNGYQDVRIRWTSVGAGDVALTLNGAAVARLTAPAAGTWDSTVRLRIAEGVSEIEVRSTSGAKVHSLTTIATPESDDRAITVEAETARTTGAATVQTAPGQSNASGGHLVGFIGNGAGNTLVVDRAAGFDTAGAYDVEIRYANAALIGDHAYNPQVVDRRLDVSEGSAVRGSSHFRYTVGWDSFWTRTLPVQLLSGSEPIIFGNADEFAPNIDRITIAPKVVGEPRTESVDIVRELALEVSAETRCVAKRTVLVATVRNTDEVPVSASIATPYGERSIATLHPARSASHAFSTRQTQVTAGEVTVTAVAQVKGQNVEVSRTATYDARRCG